MKTVSLTICVIVSTLFYVCKSPQSNAVKYTEQQETIEVQKGATFSIELVSNITTGFSWQLVDTPAVLQLKERKYLEEKDTKAGQGGADLFTFLAKESGTISIEFVYKRSWESTENKRKTYRVTIK